MADTPPPLPAPLKEGDEEPPGTMYMYALVGPATYDGRWAWQVGVAILHD